MRVIAGTARGARLKVPTRVTRPSTDRLREALFSMLAGRLEEARVLDLFAGSGALGIEALSRGAARVEFIEEQAAAARVIEANLAVARLDRGLVHAGDVFRMLRRLRGPFDLVFADPPYARGGRADLAAELLCDPDLPSRLAADGLLVLEVEEERDVPEGRGWTLLRRRVYGRSAILFYELEADS